MTASRRFSGIPRLTARIGHGLLLLLAAAPLVLGCSSDTDATRRDTNADEPTAPAAENGGLASDGSNAEPGATPASDALAVWLQRLRDDSAALDEATGCGGDAQRIEQLAARVVAVSHLVVSSDAVFAAAVTEGTDPETLADIFAEAVSHGSAAARYAGEHYESPMCEDGN